MRVLFAGICTLWVLICAVRIVLVVEDMDALNAQNLQVLVGINLGSALVALASLILIVSFYMQMLPAMSVALTTLISTVMTLGYLCEWLAFGANLGLSAVLVHVDFSQTRGGLLPYLFLDCILVCVQFAMIARESSWFLLQNRAHIDEMEKGYPLSVILNSVMALAIIASITQMTKVLFIGLYWPLTNDAVLVLGTLAAVLTVCNLILCYTYQLFSNTDVVRGTALLVLFSLAHLVVWGSMGSSTLMLGLESAESYRLFLALDAGTAMAQACMLALLQYLAYNLYIVVN